MSSAEEFPPLADDPLDPDPASELLGAFAVAYVATNSRRKGLALIQAVLSQFPEDELTAVVPFGTPRKVKARQKARRGARAALVAMMPTLLSKLPVE